MRKTYLVCYDIRDDYRLSHVAKTMRGCGDRIQYSVFECQLNETALVRGQARPFSFRVALATVGGGTDELITPFNPRRRRLRAAPPTPASNP